MKKVISLALLVFAFITQATAQANRGTESPLNRSIQGEVRLPDGSPAGIGIYVTLESDASGGFANTQTDGSGKFSFRGLANVRYRVRVKSAGYEDASEEVDLSMSQSSYLHFTLKAKAGATPQLAPEGLAAALPADMPTDAQKEYNEGFAEFQAGKLDKSIPHFKKSAEKYPKFAQTFYYLGGAYASGGKLDDAVTALQKSIELNDKAPEAYIALGTCFFQQKKIPEAEQMLTKAVEISPASFDAQYQLGRTLFVAQKTPEAQQHLEAALKLNPNSAPAHVAMGNVMLRQRNPEGALKEYQESVRLDPKGPMAEPTKQMIAKIETSLAAQKK